MGPFPVLSNSAVAAGGAYVIIVDTDTFHDKHSERVSDIPSIAL
jgi:hypothetical protein